MVAPRWIVTWPQFSALENWAVWGCEELKGKVPISENEVRKACLSFPL